MWYGGLLLFVGIIIYIAAVTGEASNRPKSSGDEPRFAYSYGPSLALTFSSFISCELTAVLAIQLYLSRLRRLKTSPPLATSSSPRADTDPCPPPRSNGRPNCLDTTQASPPRRELQPLNDRRPPPQSNCSSPGVAALKSLRSLRPHDVAMTSREMTSSSSRLTMTSADVSNSLHARRHRPGADAMDDSGSPVVDRGRQRHDAPLSPSRPCRSLSNVLACCCRPVQINGVACRKR